MGKTYPEYQVFSPEQSEFPFLNRPKVRLLKTPQANLDRSAFTDQEWQIINAVTVTAGEAGATCYSPQLWTPRDYIERGDKHRLRINGIAQTTRESGHHSTREHDTFVFAFEGVSRLAIFHFLHSHPFHVSDQMSQRYVEMADTGRLIPRFSTQSQQEIYQTASNNLYQGYARLLEILKPDTRRLVLERFPSKDKAKYETWLDKQSDSRAQEIARYLLGLDTTATLYHSCNALTLMRYHRLAASGQYSAEVAGLVEAMVQSVLDVDPRFADELPNQLGPEYLPEFNLHPTSDDYYHQADRFDSLLRGKSSRLDPLLQNSYLGEQLAQAVRLTLGIPYEKLNDEDACALVLDPAINKLLASTLGEPVMHSLSQTLNMVQLRASIKMSVVTASQVQRHRGLTHTHPLTIPIPRLEQDIIIPTLISQNQQALDIYLQVQQENIVAMQQLADDGVPLNVLSYLHTNGVAIRTNITGGLGNFFHWAKLRTCLTAQQEVYDLAVPIIQDLTKIAMIGRHFRQPAPCGVNQRAGIKPLCTEGERYCGIPVWNQTIDNYPKRNI